MAKHNLVQSGCGPKHAAAQMRVDDVQSEACTARASAWTRHTPCCMPALIWTHLVSLHDHKARTLGILLRHLLGLHSFCELQSAHLMLSALILLALLGAHGHIGLDAGTRFWQEQTEPWLIPLTKYCALNNKRRSRGCRTKQLP